MNGSPYWNPKVEAGSRDALRKLQAAKLRAVAVRAYEKSPFWRARFDDAGFDPTTVSSVDDVKRIPPMTRAEWMAAQEAHPPFGELLAVPKTAAIRYHHTSGTTGRTPLRVLDGMRDWEWIAECWAAGFWGFGIRPTDTVFFAFSYGSFIGFWGAHYACEKMGALVLPSGNMSTEQRVKQIVEMGATVVCATPTYAIRMAQTAKEMGIDLPKDAKVRRLVISGEPGGNIPATKRLIEGLWGGKACDTAGMTELGTIMMFECEHQPGGCHILEDHYIEEVLDPETLRPVPYGVKGERVVTSFGRGAVPIFRYRTSDLVVKVPHHRCPCGRVYDIYEGGFLGRVDDMLLIRGTNVYPRAIESIVRERPAIEEFRIVVERIDNVDEITVRVEVKDDPALDWKAYASDLAKDLASANEGLRINVDRAPAGSLPRFELKAKRTEDRRPR